MEDDLLNATVVIASMFTLFTVSIAVSLCLSLSLSLLRLPTSDEVLSALCRRLV